METKKIKRGLIIVGGLTGLFLAGKFLFKDKDDEFEDEADETEETAADDNAE